MKTYLGRVIRDIVGKAKGGPELEAANALMMARRVHGGTRNLNRIKGKDRDADLRAFSLLLPEVERNGKVKARKPYEFSATVGGAAMLNRSRVVTHI